MIKSAFHAADDKWAQLPQQTTETSPLALIDPRSWCGQPVPQREWLIKDWFLRRGVTLLYGDGGTGKSLLMLMLLISAALEEKWLGLDVEQTKGIGFFCEDDHDELHRRTAWIMERMNRSLSELADLKLYSGVGENNILMQFDRDGMAIIEEFYNRLEKAIIDSGARLVVLDTAADFFGGNEIVKSEVRAFLNKLAGLALKIDGAIIICSHPSVSGLTTGSGESGSKAWNNTVRCRLYFEHIKDDETGDLRTLSRKKSNYAKRDEFVTVRYDDGVFIREENSGLTESIKVQGLRNYILSEVEKRQDTERWLSMVPQTRQTGRYLPSVLRKPPEYKEKDLKKVAQQMLENGEIEFFTRNKKQGLRKGAVSRG